MPQIAVHDSKDASKIDWKEHHEFQVFTFKELTKATNNFAYDKMIGEGGFGPVYLGWLPDGREVAIKRLDREGVQGIVEFNAEVTILHSVSHKNIVRLFGYCEFIENEQQENLLVYEFIENRSLDIYLHGQTSPSPVTTSWKMRIEILLGVSRAIEYLQCYAERPVIHRDMKSSNILLDASWAPRLTDFGLALTWEGPDHKDSVMGTMGYAAPEYVATGVLNPTIDIYGFGVVTLEVLTGKRAYLSKQEREKLAKQGPYSLAEFAVPLIKAGKLRKVLDRRPAAKPTPRQLKAVKLVAQMAVRCLKMDWKARPSISEVVATLQTALELSRCDG
ncbi:unnamed protein product [Urochloa humidicola]